MSSGLGRLGGVLGAGALLIACGAGESAAGESAACTLNRAVCVEGRSMLCLAQGELILLDDCGEWPCVDGGCQRTRARQALDAASAADLGREPVDAVAASKACEALADRAAFDAALEGLSGCWFGECDQQPDPAACVRGCLGGALSAPCATCVAGFPACITASCPACNRIDDPDCFPCLPECEAALGRCSGIEVAPQ